MRLSIAPLLLVIATSSLTRSLRMNTKDVRSKPPMKDNFHDTCAKFNAEIKCNAYARIQEDQGFSVVCEWDGTKCHSNGQTTQQAAVPTTSPTPSPTFDNDYMSHMKDDYDGGLYDMSGAIKGGACVRFVLDENGKPTDPHCKEYGEADLRAECKPLRITSAAGESKPKSKRSNPFPGMDCDAAMEEAIGLYQDFLSRPKNENKNENMEDFPVIFAGYGHGAHEKDMGMDMDMEWDHGSGSDYDDDKHSGFHAYGSGYGSDTSMPHHDMDKDMEMEDFPQDFDFGPHFGKEYTGSDAEAFIRTTFDQLGQVQGENKPKNQQPTYTNTNAKAKASMQSQFEPKPTKNTAKTSAKNTAYTPPPAIKSLSASITIAGTSEEQLINDLSIQRSVLEGYADAANIDYSKIQISKIGATTLISTTGAGAAPLARRRLRSRIYRRLQDVEDVKPYVTAAAGAAAEGIKSGYEKAANSSVWGDIKDGAGDAAVAAGNGIKSGASAAANGIADAYQKAANSSVWGDIKDGASDAAVAAGNGIKSGASAAADSASSAANSAASKLSEFWDDLDNVKVQFLITPDSDVEFRSLQSQVNAVAKSEVQAAIVARAARLGVSLEGAFQVEQVSEAVEAGTEKESLLEKAAAAAGVDQKVIVAAAAAVVALLAVLALYCVCCKRNTCFSKRGEHSMDAQQKPGYRGPVPAHNVEKRLDVTSMKL